MRTPTLVVRVQLLLILSTYLLFNSDIVNFVWKTDEGEAESIVLLIFVLWWCFYCRWVAVLWRSRKLKAHLFPGGILAEAIAWHILACCNGWIFLHFFLWAITVSDFRTLEICKNLGLPSYLLSLLQSTGTQRTVSINIFISFKYTVWNQLFMKI